MGAASWTRGTGRQDRKYYENIAGWGTDGQRILSTFLFKDQRKHLTFYYHDIHI